MSMTKEQLAQWLVELDENVLQVSIMYAENYLKYGIDVTEKWNTAVRQQYALEKAKRYGFVEGRNSIITCKDCINLKVLPVDSHGHQPYWCENLSIYSEGLDWFCGDGKRKE